MKEYYIICKRHGKRKDYAFLFWGPDRKGYTYNVEKAGVYTDISEFPETHYRDDMPIEKEIVDAVSISMVIDYTTLGKVCVNNPKNRKLLKTKRSELLPYETAWDSRAFCSPRYFVKRNENVVQILKDIKKLK